MFKDILRNSITGTISITMLSGSVLAGATDIEGEVDRESGPAFVSVCKTNSKNPMPSGAIVYVSEDNILAIVHKLGQIRYGYEQTILYAVRDKERNEKHKYEAIAGRSWDQEGLFEADGGIMSTAISIDVFNYLKKQKFYFVEDWKFFLLGDHDLEYCAIEYTETERYLETIGRE